MIKEVKSWQECRKKKNNLRLWLGSLIEMAESTAPYKMLTKLTAAFKPVCFALDSEGQEDVINVFLPKFMGDVYVKNRAKETTKEWQHQILTKICKEISSLTGVKNISYDIVGNTLFPDWEHVELFSDTDKEITLTPSQCKMFAEKLTNNWSAIISTVEKARRASNLIERVRLFRVALNDYMDNHITPAAQLLAVGRMDEYDEKEPALLEEGGKIVQEYDFIMTVLDNNAS